MNHELEVVRSVRARCLRLSVDPVSGRARLVLPPCASTRAALEWASTKAEWLTRQRAALPQARPFTDGAILPIEDREVTIAWRADAPRRVVLADDMLVVGGPGEVLSRRVETWLKRQALARLSEDTAFFAARAGVTITRVSVGDARRRWGSCAATGAIRYSWRLILAPVAVRRATAAHEVAHRVHMNHGAAFHWLVAELYGCDPAEERAWLRRHGTALHWFGRSTDALAGGFAGTG